LTFSKPIASLILIRARLHERCQPAGLTVQKWCSGTFDPDSTGKSFKNYLFRKTTGNFFLKKIENFEKYTDNRSKKLNLRNMLRKLKKM